MDEIVKELMELIDSKQGENTTIIDVKELTPFSDYIFIVTTNSSVHTRSLANYIIDFFIGKNLGKYLKKRTLNLDNPWVLIDGGTIIVNLFLKETREFYNLENLYFKGKNIN